MFIIHRLIACRTLGLRHRELGTVAAGTARMERISASHARGRIVNNGGSWTIEAIVEDCNIFLTIAGIHALEH